MNRLLWRLAGAAAVTVAAAPLAWTYLDNVVLPPRQQRADVRALHHAWQAPAPAPEPAAPRPGEEYAVLTIPRIGVTIPIVEGITPRDLRRGAGHYPGSAPLGSSTGNAAVAGHRNIDGSPFLHLADLQAGDPVIVETRGHRWTYRVVGQFTVTPDRGDVATAGAAGGALTLTTCWDGTDRRLIVRARLPAAQRASGSSGIT